ncbi:12720_t:CDS:2 [Funneliformis geosporum]|nr:12720_t:CDS:2 [Funneliformis geosporum]
MKISKIKILEKELSLAHLIRTKFPIVDFVTDTLSVLDQAIRILQSIIDITVENNMLKTCLHTMSLLQCIKQLC